MKLQIGASTFLFTGDANGKERKETDATLVGHVEEALLRLEAQRPGTLKADVLKVPHHGSETASTEPFIRKVNPEFAVISASTTHDLPRQSVVDRYEDGDRLILRTDKDGAFNNDHILCVKAVGVPLECNYAVDFDE
jgi:competence protein ComEC